MQDSGGRGVDIWFSSSPTAARRSLVSAAVPPAAHRAGTVSMDTVREAPGTPEVPSWLPILLKRIASVHPES